MKVASQTKNLFVPVALFTGKLCKDAGKEVELLQSNESDAELEAYHQLAKEKSSGWNLTEQGLLLKGDQNLNQTLDIRLRPLVDHFQDDGSEFVAMVDYAQGAPTRVYGPQPFEV
ncbi:hypothetical protein E4U58_004745 [Claviceps cyperi]|nr:hypothetical protein E4U58_004745 [Claviceps cyperi]